MAPKLRRRLEVFTNRRLPQQHGAASTLGGQRVTLAGRQAKIRFSRVCCGIKESGGTVAKDFRLSPPQFDHGILVDVDANDSRVSPQVLEHLIIDHKAARSVGVRAHRNSWKNAELV